MKGRTEKVWNLSVPLGVTGSNVDYTGTSMSNKSDANMEHSDSQGSNDTIKITPQFAPHLKPKVILLCPCDCTIIMIKVIDIFEVTSEFFVAVFRETRWGLCLCPGEAVWRVFLHEHSAWHHLTAREWVLTCLSSSPRCHLHLQVMPDITQHQKRWDNADETKRHTLIIFVIIDTVHVGMRPFEVHKKHLMPVISGESGPAFSQPSPLL